MNQRLFGERIERLRDATVIAVLRMPSGALATEAVGAGVRGGFEAVEITMNTPDATDALAGMAGSIEAMIGAGTVTEPEQVKEAYDAGAEFIVTPVVAPEVVEAAHSLSVPVAMGASTPTEILTARRAGADWVKIFPAEQLGGPDYLRMVLGPLSGTRVMVTGGLTAENYLSYLHAGAELAGFTTTVFDPLLAREGRFDEIERRAIEVCRRLDIYATE